MTSHKIRLFIAILILASVSCSFVTGKPTTTPESPASQEPAGQMPDSSSAIPPTQTEVPVPSGPQPIGVATQTSNGLAFYGMDGTLKNSVTLPNSEYISWGQMIFAGGFSDSMAPTIYFSFEDEGSLMVKAPASIYPLQKLDNLNALVGVPGKDVFAYSRLDFSANTEQLPSELYVGTIAATPVTPVTTLTDPESWMLRALAIDMDGDTPVGVWYTLGAWGIGGDIVFEPRKGLFYYELGNGTTTEWLDRQSSPIALSNDLTWVAYTSAGPIGGPNGGVNLRNFDSGQTVNIPLAPITSEPRGAGNGVFSPNNSYIAWREGSGWQMADTPDFHSRIRVADLDGNLVLDIQDSAFSGQHSDWVHSWPVAWLDSQTLLVQIGWGDTAVLARISLTDQTPTLFANGAFIGFMYP